MKPREMAAWATEVVRDNALQALILLVLGSGWAALSPKLLRIWQIAWSGPQAPIQLSQKSALFYLGIAAVILAATIYLVVNVWRQGRELKVLREHKCPSVPEPRSYVGPQFLYYGVYWIPVLYRGPGGETIQIGDPLCHECGAPLYHSQYNMSECPTASCKNKRYFFSPSMAVVQEKARRAVIGEARAKKYKFPGYGT